MFHTGRFLREIADNVSVSVGAGRLHILNFSDATNVLDVVADLRRRGGSGYRVSSAPDRLFDAHTADAIEDPDVNAEDVLTAVRYRTAYGNFAVMLPGNPDGIRPGLYYGSEQMKHIGPIPTGFDGLGRNTGASW